MTIVEITCITCGTKFDGYHNTKYCKTCKHKNFAKAAARYRERHVEIVTTYRKQYKKTPHGRLVSILSNAKRRAILKNVIHDFTLREWNKKVNATKGICPICKKHVGYEGMTLDHIFPISKAEKGRSYTIDDIQALCLACNISKHDKIIN